MRRISSSDSHLFHVFKKAMYMHNGNSYDDCTPLKYATEDTNIFYVLYLVNSSYLMHAKFQYDGNTDPICLYITEGK